MNWTVDLLSPLRDQPDRLIAIILEQARLLESLLRQQSQWEQEKAQVVAALQSVREKLRVLQCCGKSRLEPPIPRLPPLIRVAILSKLLPQVF